MDRRCDQELLTATSHGDGEAFGEFYERHEDVVLAYFLRRSARADVAADLAAETFAQALRSAHRFSPGPAPAIAWLFGIARNVLADSFRRGRVEDAARNQLGMSALTLDRDTLESIEKIDADAVVEGLLAQLPRDQRAAVRARIVDGRAYSDIARELVCSESVVRKRVSRGLDQLRRYMEANRT